MLLYNIYGEFTQSIFRPFILIICFFSKRPVFHEYIEMLRLFTKKFLGRKVRAPSFVHREPYG